MKPYIFLDFDRTLFDTDKFYEWIGDNRVERLAQLTSGRISAPDFSQFLYGDTEEFLQLIRGTHKLILLTYTINIVLQEMKIQGSGIIKYFDEVIMVSGEDGGLSGKGTATHELLLHLNEPGWEHVFIDDSPKNIDEVKRMNPEISCIRIDRVTHAQGMLHGELLTPDHIIRNLKELDGIL